MDKLLSGWVHYLVKVSSKTVLLCRFWSCFGLHYLIFIIWVILAEWFLCTRVIFTTRERLGEINIFETVDDEVLDVFVEELLFIEDRL